MFENLSISKAKLNTEKAVNIIGKEFNREIEEAIACASEAGRYIVTVRTPENISKDYVYEIVRNLREKQFSVTVDSYYSKYMFLEISWRSKNNKKPWWYRVLFGHKSGE